MGKHTRYTALALTLVALAGCATDAVIQSRNMKNYPDVQYEGPFRGRWWSYYERGRAFADTGKYWAEAEADFRTAMITRKGDQLWPRTYGLHFIPEYFPNRELGIALYHQGRYDEAIEALRLSYSQQESARAAYFIERALKDKLSQAGADTQDPTIELSSPTGGLPVGSLMVDVEGVARDDNFIARVTIDGEPVALKLADNPVSFKKTVVLRPGQNTIVVETEDVLGKKATATVDINTDVDGPALSFDRPVTLPGTLTGVARDPNGVESLTVAGQTAALSPQADGSVAFSVNVAGDAMTPPVQYESIDSLGNTTSGDLNADGVMVSSILPDAVYASATPSVTTLSNGMRALSIGGQLVALAAAPAPAVTSPEIRFTNLREGQRFLLDEILVNLDVVAPSPVSDIALNGIALDTVPGRTVQRLSRRVRLDEGANTLEATVRDAQGNAATAGLTIDRALSPLEDTQGRLAVSLLGNVWKGKGPAMDDEDSLILSLLDRELHQYGRFNFVNRDDLATVLTEQQLSAALGSREARAEIGSVALGSITPAEVLLIGRVYRDADSIEIVVEAVSSETSLFVARADVAGSADTPEELEQLVRDLALRTYQEFPRAYGEVLNVRGTETAQVTTSKASMAVLAQSSLEASGAPDAEVETALEEIRRELTLTDRFSLVERDNIDAVLAEQDLSAALGAPDAQLALQAVDTPDWLIRLTLNRDGLNATAIVEAVDTATSAIAADHMAQGAIGSPDDLVLLIREAVGALAAELPEKAAAPTPVEYSRGFVSSLSAEDLVRESMKYVVYREGHDIVDPITKQVVGKQTEIVGEALVQAVGNAESTAEVVISRENQPVGVIQVGDKVVVK